MLFVSITAIRNRREKEFGHSPPVHPVRLVITRYMITQYSTALLDHSCYAGYVLMNQFSVV